MAATFALHGWRRTS
ncbi:trp operon leader peptide [Salmonella enterica subsp. enterica]|nr:trp operon leader peptide [Salmonella enterica subsp. enterica]